MKSLEIQRTKRYLLSTGIYDIPSDWLKSKFEEVIEDLQPGFASGERDPDGVFQLRMNNITFDGQLELDDLLMVPRPSDISKYNIKRDDILFNNTNSLDLIGKTTIVKEDLEFTFSNHITRIRVKKEKVIPYWLYVILLRYRERSVFKSICNTFVGQSGIGREVLKQLPVFMPPIREQLRITSILTEFDDLIHKAYEIMKQTETLKKGLTQRLFTKGIGHTKFQNTKFGKIPAGWNILPITDCCNDIFLGLTSKVDYVKDGGIPLIRAKDIATGKLRFDETLQISKQQHELLTRYHKPKKGDILISKSGSLGVCALVDTSREFSIYESIIDIQAREELLIPDFLLAMMRSEHIQRKLFGNIVGMAVGHINLSDFKKLYIPVPELSEQKEIATIISNVDSVINTQNDFHSGLAYLRRGLRQKLLTGKIRVTI